MKIVPDLVLSRKMVNRKAETQSTILPRALLKVETNTLRSNHSAPDLSKGVNQYRLTNHFFNGVRNNDEPNLFILFICNISIG